MLLSRTADALYWMARYLERAENLARMLDVATQMVVMTPNADHQKSWEALLSISELNEAYLERHDAITEAGVIDFLVNDETHPNSISSCLMCARENARSVRGNITTELWEVHNSTWLEWQAIKHQNGITWSHLFDWVKNRSHLARGVTTGTMLQDEAMTFIRLGTFLERADNTARLVDVKFYELVAEGQQSGKTAAEIDQHYDLLSDGGTTGYYHWVSLLRSVSAFEVYRKVYSDVVTADKVVALLMLHPALPRSLVHCMQAVVVTLKEQIQRHGNQPEMVGGFVNSPSMKLLNQAQRLLASLQYSELQEILNKGLHASLDNFLQDINQIANGVSDNYLVPLTQS